MKNSNDTIGNRTRDLPAYGAVPHPSVSRRATQLQMYVSQITRVWAICIADYINKDETQRETKVHFVSQTE